MKKCSDLLKNSQLFWNLSAEQLEKLAEVCEEQSFEAGFRIFNEGESVRNTYILIKGKVALEMEIRIGLRKRNQAVIDVIETNEVFGASSISDNPVGRMSATAIENSTVLTLDGRRVHELCGVDTDMGYKVMQELARLVSDRLSQAKHTLAHVLSVTSHDLRAPLATVQSSLETVAGGYAGEINAKQKGLLMGSRQRIADLLSMIDNLLDISYVGIRSEDFKMVNLVEVIDSSLGDVAGMAHERGQSLRNRTPPELPPVLGISKHLRQVLTNLLSNAVKFTPRGGSISIRALELPDKVQIDVSDTGIGISAEELPKIFDEFYRGKKVEVEGAGLGLSIAKKIVEAHGGSIWVESPDQETGIGTRFSVALSRVHEAPKVSDDEGKRSIAGAKILVADDDPDIRRSTALILESQGYKVRTAEDGLEAVQEIKEDEPDLLILDLLMPRMDGFEVCKWLEENRRRGGRTIPVLILSAVKEECSRKRYELETEGELDVEDYVTKPIAPPVLLQLVEKSLLRKEAIGATNFTITRGGEE